MKNTVISNVKATFEKYYNIQPLLIFSSGRINLIGEHTDYNDGFVLPASINKGIVAGLSKSTSAKSKITALDLQDSFEIDINHIKPAANGSWKNYVLGVVSEIQKLSKKIDNFNVVFGGNIPHGSGLSSSAALENSIAFGLNELFELNLTRAELLKISQKAEHNFVGVKCGIMDQFTSMMGDKDHALFLDCRDLTNSKIPLKLGDYQLVLYNTNVKHSLGDSAYNERRASCENVVEKLQKTNTSIKALRDVTVAKLNEIKSELSEESYQRACYVIEENNRVLKAISALEKGDIFTFGKLMFESHEGLKTKYQVSCDELDFLVDKAIENPHIIGSRMMGGGFGGCTINLIKKSEVTSITQQFEQTYFSHFNKKLTPIIVELGKGTHIIS